VVGWCVASRGICARRGVDCDALESAYAADLDGMQADCVEFAKSYDADHVYDTYLEAVSDERDGHPSTGGQAEDGRVAVLVPAMKRPGNVPGWSSRSTSNDGTASLYYVCDEDDTAQIAAVEAAGVEWIEAKRGTSFACKINAGYDIQTASRGSSSPATTWSSLPGWIEAARELSDRYDVIGTNDSEPGRVRNPKVANGSHSDHFFVRRDYIADEGSSLEGPGTVMAEAYFHWYGDAERSSSRRRSASSRRVSTRG
jgi:hypothetical protein